MPGQFTGRVDWQLILRHCVMIQILDQEIRNSTCVNNSPLSTQYIIAVTMPYCWFPHPVHLRLWNLPSSPKIYSLLMRFKQCSVVPISLKSWDTWALVVFYPYPILPAMGRNGQNCKWNCKLLLPTSTFMWILREIWTGRIPVTPPFFGAPTPIGIGHRSPLSSGAKQPMQLPMLSSNTSPMRPEWQRNINPSTVVLGV